MASFKVGDRVVQANYGPGTITGADDHHTVINFDEHGVKTFATSLVSLERTASPAPQKAAKARRTAKAGTAKADTAKAGTAKADMAKAAPAKSAPKA
jgi:topoisomerase IA-like protein